VPDVNFELYLIGEGLDNIQDNYVITDIVNTITELDLRNLGIRDLTGIESFTSLEQLDCRGNNFTSLNFSENIKLEDLVVFGSDNLSELNLNNNVSLRYLWVGDSQLTTLNLDNCNALETLKFSFNDEITNLDLTKNTNLVDVVVERNDQLANLDLSSNSRIQTIDAGANNLTSLNVSNCSALKTLSVDGNNLSSLNLSTNVLLESVNISYNQISSLNLSENTSLNWLGLLNNQLESLDVSQIVSLDFMQALGNPLLSCIQVNQSQLNNKVAGWNNDSNVSYSLNCSGTSESDSDGDGVPDSIDQCPGQDDALIGTSCDDGNPNTINDIYDENCGCSGTPDGGSNGDTVTDIDGNEYNTVQIGSQIWMAENLKTTKYRNGDVIPNITNSSDWIVLNTGAYSNYDNDENNSNIFGRLYNWYAIDDSRNLCPQGWHVSTSTDWSILADFLGGVSIAGGKLKDTESGHWDDPNTGATNSSNFTALPGGYRYAYAGYFSSIFRFAEWWNLDSFPSPSNAQAYQSSVQWNSIELRLSSSEKEAGKCVRCVKD
jgi:uncharacterized protein (TIGR02145 family)